MEESKPEGGRTPRISFEQRLEAVRRLEAGEKHHVLAEELGVTRQYVSLLWKQYREEGEAGLKVKGPGRKKGRRLTEAELDRLCELVRTHEKPSDAGIPAGKSTDVWEAETLKKLVRREFQFTPMKVYMMEVCRAIGVPVKAHTAAGAAILPDHFYEYLETPLAKQIRQREEELLDEWVKPGAKLARRGRRKSAASAESGEKEGYEDMEAIRAKVEETRLKMKGARPAGKGAKKVAPKSGIRRPAATRKKVRHQKKRRRK